MVTGLIILIVLQVISIVGSILTIGDERKPRSKGEAVFGVILGSILIIFYIALINRLNNAN